jgi:flagellar basal body-associated protein FliL
MEEEIKTEIKKPKKKWIDKKVILTTIVIVLVFMAGIVAGVFVTYNQNINEPYKLGQQSILEKYACSEKPGYNIEQCLLPECLNQT